MKINLEDAKQSYFNQSPVVGFGVWFTEVYAAQIKREHQIRIRSAGTMKQALRTIKELGYE